MEKSEEIWKKMKPIMQKAGCDMAAVRDLQKMLDKAHKQFPGISARYQNAKDAAIQIDALARQLEQLLFRADIQDKVWCKQVLEIGRTFKKMRGAFEHEFVISSTDREFYLTYDTLIQLIGAVTGKAPDFLIMRSETENLLDLLKEALQRPQPPMLELSYFYMNHTDKELMELPPMEKIQLLKTNMREHFIMPLGHQMGLAVKYVVARYKQLEGNDSRRAVTEREEMSILFPTPQTSEAANQLIRQLLNQLCTTNGRS